ncbi:MAG: 30S ribosomal protein S9 [Candidatus Cloacimonadota bacterium]|jgi:small subunit ribosomal protein S9|uniref:Small ribosomal subunit protein uS9 n=1 Tax=Cloacimonas acidaminovorans (strain Evry) TaxID=459349 RepID=B0VJN4_CLOAI|nr:30S ribosomal protein S9 [Candidatus Cloacimonas acidaminovorans]MBP8705552.1 30S ribosomal protein S9 [Candidatus Cloacimonas sp.]MDI9572260.1 30S ribosomal protein S9 [Candidatus Cloacimonadota bacterium]MDD3605962.1 30S ribosomal protein S9 [Candidatus Cloacimonas acidaminovorans]MDD5407861.1 30S ribosomal protein S9 [Candidatus Cloacimonas acidaminovorans]MDY0218656.1 30S ribosomal protein S9 [Candidatus Cloacimonas acidaminovorans]
MQTFDAVGRRKNAVARVRLMPGTGKRIINNIQMKKYLQRETLEMIVEQPLQTVGLSDNFDVYVNVYGGGLSGQAGAIRHGISRALVEYDENLRPVLKTRGFLTRDPRMVERKKSGRPKARKRFQFSKR